MVPQGLPPGNDPLPHSVAITAPQCRGVVVAGAAEALAPLFAALPDTAQLQLVNQLQLVKQSRVRTVLRGSFGGVDVHVKLFRTATLSDRAKGSVRGSRGSREARNLLGALALGLPAATPLACGEIRAPGERGARAFLVTATIAGASAFAFDLPAPALAAAGRLLRRAHDAGALPRDLHPGNLVVDAEHTPWLLDLASLAHTGDAALEHRAAALAFFCQELDAGPLDARAQALLLAYLGEGAELPDFGARLAKAARAMRSRALAAFGRRSSRECRHTVVPPRVRGQWRWYLHQVEDAADRAPLHAACLAFADSPPAPAKTGRRGSLWMADDLVVKQREQGKAQRLFRAMYWLQFARIPQAEPVALARRADRGLVFARRLPMPSVADELARGALAGEALRAAAVSLGDSVGRLHAHGLRNRDLKLENLVRDPAGAAVCMVDLDGVRRKRPGDARGQGADLGRLLAAFTAAGSPGGSRILAAFVRAYLRARQRLLQPAPARRLWRRAVDRARQWFSAHR